MRHPHLVCLVMLLGIVLLVSGAIQATSASSPTITLSQPLHCTGPDGSDVLTPAGRYQLEPAGSQMRLVSIEGIDAFVVAAAAASHQEALTAPVALTIKRLEGEHHLVLLLPGGQGLMADGSVSGVQSRGTTIVPYQKPLDTRITATEKDLLIQLLDKVTGLQGQMQGQLGQVQGQLGQVQGQLGKIQGQWDTQGTLPPSLADLWGQMHGVQSNLNRHCATQNPQYGYMCGPKQ